MAQATIDTGASHCQLPRSTAVELRARPFRRGRVLLADGSIQEREIVYIQVEVDASLPPVLTTAVVGPEDSPFLVGAVALEQLDLGIDPRSQKLVPEVSALLRTANWPTV
ncbi:MAG: hypothetical protein HYY02_08445 [Chloroflexi bacterium]|nr:hypothetical protein [Chloroflexota bacterium]